MLDRLTWGDAALTLDIEWSGEKPPYLAAIKGHDGLTVSFDGDLPLVDLVTANRGHLPANDRLVNTHLGSSLRYLSHKSEESDGVRALEITMTADDELRVILTLTARAGTAAIRASTRVVNDSSTRSSVVRSLTTWTAPFGAAFSGDASMDDWLLVDGISDWLAEGRWRTRRVRGFDFPDIAQHLTGHNPRGSLSAVSSGSWSTGNHLPVAALASDRHRIAWLWEVEHNGAWRWEVGESGRDGYFALSGPTDTDHAWTAPLAPGESFDSVPATVAISTTVQGAVGELTAARRAQRRPHADNSLMPVVFNDYMNTLNGDPTTEKLLPLIDAAAEAGAQVFCVDAGWYDDTGHWWDSVGEWLPSTRRFPRGLREVIERIRDRGLVPGLWLEPEVVGIRSPIADALPLDAFFQRNGARIVEHDRYHLDLRHPAAIAHLDAVIDRLVGDFGIGFFKFDYNIDPGSGTDVNGHDPGAGLLGHNRAQLEWIDSILDRYPDLILENCASGAMRMDGALLSRMQLQSTSDQQDFLKYPPIAASAPMSMLPEQAASWAYPQPSMNDEELAFSLTTGILGRFYLSGYLNRMTAEQRETVAEAVDAYRSIRAEVVQSTPFWPLGMPGWDDPWVALGLNSPGAMLATLWNRDATGGTVELSIPELRGNELTVETVFPRRLEPWLYSWDSVRGVLTVVNPTGNIGARTISLVEARPRCPG